MPADRPWSALGPLLDYSEYGQALLLRRYLPPDVPRVLVEVGAYDGVQGSNSRQLLREGWRGVLVEPMPQQFAQLQAATAAFDVHLFNGAIGDHDGQALIRYRAGDETGQEASLYVHRADDRAHPVALRTLTTLLAEAAVPSVFGLLLIDTERGDLEVLQGLDFARFQPAVIVTEEYGPKDAAKQHLLHAAGYDHREKIGADSIWTSRRLVAGRDWPEAMPPLVHPVAAETFLAGRHETGGHIVVDAIAPDLSLIRGWAHLGPGRPVPPEVGVLLALESGARLCFRGFRCPRRDVAEHFARPDLLLSGFRIHLPAELAGTAVRRMRLVQRDGERVVITAEPLGLG